MNRHVARLSLLCALLPVSARAQQGTFILRSGNDTISVERFTRTPTSLQTELLLRTASVRMGLTMDIGADGMVPKLESRVWGASDPATAPPKQLATITFRGDSVIVEISGSPQPAIQRLGTTAGALPYVNPSFAMVEVLIQRARRLGGASAVIPLFLVAGGQTTPATVKTISADSVSVAIGGGDLRLAVDLDGRVLGGNFVGQPAVLERVAGNAVSFAVEKPDYSPPAGAPYTAEDVTVPTPMGHTLAGTLTLPKGAGPGKRVPAVVTITGSGPEDRDEAIPMFKGYRPFREFADSLGRRGIAVLRMDDRGFGGSGGNAATATSADFAEDIRAGLAYLRTRAEIDPARLALMGHSEGGIIAPMVAVKEPALRAMVLLAGTAYTGRKVLTFQMNNGINNQFKLPAYQDSAAKRDAMLAHVPQTIDSIAGAVPWMKFFIDYDPLTTARRVKTPVLVLNGATDQQVTPDQAPELEKAFKAAGNRDVTMKIYPDLNHLFVYDPSGYPGAYTSLKSFMVDRAVIGQVVDWLVRQLQSNGAT
ncbi:MAG: alpha/beta fold hydrolase [Gemmatimonadota bacterium]